MLEALRKPIAWASISLGTIGFLPGCSSKDSTSPDAPNQSSVEQARGKVWGDLIAAGLRQEHWDKPALVVPRASKAGAIVAESLRQIVQSGASERIRLADVYYTDWNDTFSRIRIGEHDIQWRARSPETPTHLPGVTSYAEAVVLYYSTRRVASIQISGEAAEKLIPLLDSPEDRAPTSRMGLLIDEFLRQEDRKAGKPPT